MEIIIVVFLTTVSVLVALKYYPVEGFRTSYSMLQIRDAFESKRKFFCFDTVFRKTSICPMILQRAIEKLSETGVLKSIKRDRSGRTIYYFAS